LILTDFICFDKSITGVDLNEAYPETGIVILGSNSGFDCSYIGNEPLFPFQNETQISNRGGSLLRIGDTAPAAEPGSGGEPHRKRGTATAHGATFLFWKGYITIFIKRRTP
jgi:hypothetical protein